MTQDNSAVSQLCFEKHEWIHKLIIITLMKEDLQQDCQTGMNYLSVLMN